MLTEKEAQQLMEDFIELRQIANTTKNKKDIIKLQTHENICVQKFKYLITMRTGRYKHFANYDDLNQEGFEALLKAMKNYNPTKGIFFYWAHRYIETRIARSANLHTAIRYPLKYAKANTPKRESMLPIIIECKSVPDKNVEKAEIEMVIKGAIDKLNSDQKNLISLAYGFDGDKPLSINKICKKMKISRANCVKVINNALNVLKQNIRL